MNTRKHPRTLEDAFGPYARGPIEETDRPLDWQDAVVVVGSIVTATICIVLVLAGWII